MRFMMSGGPANVPLIRSRGALIRRAACIFSAAAALCLVASLGHAAQSPFGVALPEAAPSAAGGPFKSFFLWIAQQQSEFYKAMVEAVKAIKSSGHATWFLVGLSFLYGVFHAAGPGHGKVVLSSYVLASNETARTGIVVSFAASLVQAVSAIALIGVAAVALNLTSIAITDTTAVFETGSYALVAALGLFLVWKKVVRPLGSMLARSRPGLVAVPAGAGEHNLMQQHEAVHHGHHDHDHHAHSGHHHHHHHHDHDHGAHDHCCHMTGADQAAAISRSATPVKDAMAAILAVGMRPCSGALIVLVFALSQGLFWAGILATFAMALGTGIVVAALVLLSVAARDTALKLASGQSRLAGRVQAVLEGFAAMFVLGIGLSLLYASLLKPALG